MFVAWKKEITGTCLTEHRCNYCKKNIYIYQPRKSYSDFVCENGTTVMVPIQMTLWSEPYAGYQVYVQYFFPQRISVKYPVLDQCAVQIRVRLYSNLERHSNNSRILIEYLNPTTIKKRLYHKYAHTHSHMYIHVYVYSFQCIKGFRNTILNLLAT